MLNADTGRQGASVHYAPYTSEEDRSLVLQFPLATMRSGSAAVAPVWSAVDTCPSGAVSHSKGAGPTTESPFELIDELRRDEEKLAEIIDFIRLSLRADYRGELAARIKDLIKIAEEEEPDQPPLSSESLRHFVSFMQSITGISLPEIVITPTGNVRAEWHTGRCRHFSVEFQPRGATRFVLFLPNRRHPRITDRISGIVSWDSLFDLVMQYRIGHWIIP